MTALPRAYGFAAAAAKLREAGHTKLTEYWLRSHLDQVPHTRIGREITFTDDQLRAFLDGHSHTPEVKELRPVDRRRRAS